MRQLVVALLVVGSTQASRPASGGCSMPMPIANPAVGTSNCGGFDFTAVPVDKAPTVRFWAYGHGAEMNSGSQKQDRGPGDGWLINASSELGVKDANPALFSVFQANWTGPQINGCIMALKPEERRTVFEISLVNPKTEGTAAHAGFYAVSSVAFANSMFDLDTVKGASGANGNVVPLAPIPVPKVLSTPTPLGTDFQAVELELAAPVSYSEGGKDSVALIRGYRVLYASGEAPKTSDPGKYKPALDPSDPKKELGSVKAGKVRVAIPRDAAWLVSQLVYEDPSSILSSATSGHTGLSVGAPDAGGRSRKRAK